MYYVANFLAKGELMFYWWNLIGRIRTTHPIELDDEKAQHEGMEWQQEEELVPIE